MKVEDVKLAIPEIQMDSVVDGEGIRSVIWFQGCNHKCFNCQNPETWDFEGGTKVAIEDVKKQIRELFFREELLSKFLVIFKNNYQMNDK